MLLVPAPMKTWVCDSPALFASGASIGSYQLSQIMKALSHASPTFRGLMRELYVRPTHKADLGPVFVILHPSFSSPGRLREILEDAGGQWRPTEYGDATLAIPMGPVRVEVARPPPERRGAEARQQLDPVVKQAESEGMNSVTNAPWKDILLQALAYPGDETANEAAGSSSSTGVWATPVL